MASQPKAHASLDHVNRRDKLSTILESARLLYDLIRSPPDYERWFEAYVVGTLLEAGSGTTAAAMMSFVLAMVYHPDWQQRMQEEVYRVVGTERLPEFEDLPRLPLVRAIIKDNLRWRPVTAGGKSGTLVALCSGRI